MNKTIKFIGITLVFLSLFSCFYNGNLNHKERARKMVSQKEIKYKRIDPNKRNIKTNLFYKSLDYYYDEGENKIKYFSSNQLNPDFVVYRRFYNSGTILSYSKKRSDTIFNKLTFDIKNAGIGFVLDKRDNILVEYDAKYGGNFIERKYEVKEDTLIIKFRNNLGYRIFYYYKEFEVPIEVIEIPEF